MSTSPASIAPVQKGLSKAIEANIEAAAAVQEAADELGVVHAVLTNQVAEIAAEGDAANAVERTAILEEKLSETAGKMVEVNQALAEQQASIAHLSRAV